MAIRNDITFDWESNPRKITVDAPSIEFTMQDMLDTLRDEEAKDTNMDNPSIVIGSGKVVLDDQGNAVGLTIQLINATVGFETRPGPSWIECNLSGGNLSGLEADGITVTTQVTHNNPYVNINKTSSVSATISASATDNRLDYRGILNFDANNISGTGTVWPIGTSANPVNNIADGIAIATLYSLSEVNAYSNITMDRDVSNFNIHGVTPDLILNPNGFKMELCQLDNLNLTGNFNNSLLHIFNCELLTLQNIYGKIRDSSLNGTLTISAGEDILIAKCVSGIAGLGSPIIDMCLGEDTTVSLRAYSGGITVINADTPASVATLEFIAGKPHLEPSCTAGYISVRGVATLDDRSNGTTIDTSSLDDPKKTDELHKLQGLDINNPMTVTPTQRSVDTIDLTLSGDGETVTVVTRQ